LKYISEQSRASTPASTAPPIPTAPKRIFLSTRRRLAEADYLINVELCDTAALLAWWYGKKQTMRRPSA